VRGLPSQTTKGKEEGRNGEATDTCRPPVCKQPTFARRSSRCSLVGLATISSSCARSRALKLTAAALLATAASILIDDTDAAVFVARIEVPIFLR